MKRFPKLKPQEQIDHEETVALLAGLTVAVAFLAACVAAAHYLAAWLQ